MNTIQETPTGLFNGYEIILGSSSPRRHAFMNALEIPFTIAIRSIEETYNPNLKKHEITEFLAKEKTKPYLNDLSDKQILITSDTIVWHQEKALMKPKNEQEAFEMIESLSNSTHDVISSVAFTTTTHQKVVTDTTKVTFQKLYKPEIQHYIKHYKPLDKAGSYGIQDWIGLIGISKIEGNYNTVVGMPTHLVYRTLLEMTTSSKE